MSAEDRLRDVLRSEAQAVLPSGDGLARIQARVARRRRRLLWSVPSAALATAGALLAFLVLTPDDRSRQTLVPGDDPTPSITASPAPAPTPSALPADDGYSGPAVWPFTSRTQAQAWDEQAMPWADESLEVGRRFVRDFLGLSDVTVRQDCASCEELTLAADGRQIGTLALAHYDVDGDRLFTVVGATSPGFALTTPKRGDLVTSPLGVSGTVEGADESIRVQLVTSAGTRLAEVFAPAGSGAPWRTALEWTDRSWTRGAIVLRTGNARDGATTRLVVAPVSGGRATTPVGPAFSALVDGHVSLYDGTTGALVRQLTFPPAGKVDAAAAWADGTVLWVRQGQDSSCGGELDLRTAERTRTLGTATTFRYRTPQLSGDATLVGWVEAPCGTAPHTLVIQPRPQDGVATPARRIVGPTGSTVELLDLRADGAALVLTNDREATGPGAIGLLRPGAEKLDGLTPIAGEPGCFLTRAAFDGEQVVGFQACEDGIQLLRWRADGTVAGKEKALADEPVESITVRDGRIMVQRFSGDLVGAIALYADGRFRNLTSPDPRRCSSNADLRGCVTSPDW